MDGPFLQQQHIIDHNLRFPIPYKNPSKCASASKSSFMPTPDDLAAASQADLLPVSPKKPLATTATPAAAPAAAPAALYVNDATATGSTANDGSGDAMDEDVDIVAPAAVSASSATALHNEHGVVVARNECHDNEDDKNSNMQEENKKIPSPIDLLSSSFEAIEARRKLFHDHAGVSKDISRYPNAGIAKAIQELPRPVSQHLSASSSGRLLCPNHHNTTSTPTNDVHNTNGQQEQVPKTTTTACAVPLLLSELERQSKKRNVFLSNPRPSFVSRTIDQLEQSIRSLHHQRSRNDNNGTTGENGDDNDDDDSSAANSVRALTLQFNECSVACVSKWVACKLERQNSSRAVTTATGTPPRQLQQPPSNAVATRSPEFYFSSVNAYFRQCGVCDKTGHYELECPQQTSDQTKLLLELSKQCSNGEVPKQRKHSATNGETATRQTIRPHNKLKRRKPGTLVMDASSELCNGFLVEQRAEPWADYSLDAASSHTTLQQHDNSDNGFLDETIDIDGFTIRATKEGPLLDRFVSFKKGDLVGWLSGGSDRVLRVGVLISPFDSSDLVGKASVRCISVISPEHQIGVESNNNSHNGEMGKIFNVSKAEIFSVSDTLPTPSEGGSSGTSISASVTGNSVAAANGGVHGTRLGASRSKDPPVRRQSNAKFKGKGLGGKK